MGAFLAVAFPLADKVNRARRGIWVLVGQLLPKLERLRLSRCLRFHELEEAFYKIQMDDI